MGQTPAEGNASLAGGNDAGSGPLGLARACRSGVLAAADEVAVFLQRCRLLPHPPAEGDDRATPRRREDRAQRERRREIRAIFDRLDADHNQRVSPPACTSPLLTR